MNAEQQNAFEHIKNGDNVLLQGSAGTGKSFTLKEVIRWALKEGKKIGVTATTGSAAILIRGTTVHSFLGIGLGTKSPEYLADFIKSKKKFIYNRLRKLQILIIDEISMMDANLFELISEFLSIVRGNDTAFGGVQIVLCGDVFQLPPVKSKYFFKSELWNTLPIKICNLKESQRHKEDLEFIKILEELRWGKCTKKILKTLRATKNNTFSSDIIPTMLYSRNVDVDSYNTEKQNELIKNGAKSLKYQTRYSNEPAKIWAQSCKIPTEIDLCEGAQVVVTWNIKLDEGLCNGTRGVITKVDTNGVTIKLISGQEMLIEFVKVENEDNSQVWIEFLPLRLAYALTVNKSQGMTLDCAVVAFDFGTCNSEFVYGRAYTALSRVRNLKSIRVLNVDIDSFQTHPDVIEFHKCNV